MIANYHTHTVRCNHAFGTEREYIENAIANGVKILGFSDHAPYPRESYGEYRMRVLREDVPDYFDTLIKLREEYKKDIEIYIGFETEYFPARFEEFKSYVSRFPLDYLILGQHFIPDEFGVYVGLPTSDEGLLKLYADICVEGISTDCFTYIAHPDVINFTGDREVYKREMLRILDACKKHGMPVEFNLLGFRDGRHYPSPEFFRIVKENGNPVILGSDAHRPEHCGDSEIYERGKLLLNDMDIIPIDTAELKKPKLI